MYLRNALSGRTTHVGVFSPEHLHHLTRSETEQQPPSHCRGQPHLDIFRYTSIQPATAPPANVLGWPRRSLLEPWYRVVWEPTTTIAAISRMSCSRPRQIACLRFAEKLDGLEIF